MRARSSDITPFSYSSYKCSAVFVSLDTIWPQIAFWKQQEKVLPVALVSRRAHVICFSRLRIVNIKADAFWGTPQPRWRVKSTL